MAVVKVGIVGMRVAQPFMAMPMRMMVERRSGVLVLMVCIMDVAVFMLEHFVNMHMLVPFGKMQP